MHCNEILRVYVNRKHRFSYNKIYTGLGGKEPEIPCQIYILNETESMARGTSIAMPDSALVTTTMSSACTNNMPRKLLCKTVRSDILFVYVSYWREMLVISETQIACYLFEKKTWKIILCYTLESIFCEFSKLKTVCSFRFCTKCL